MKDYSFTITNKPVNSTASKVMQKGQHFEYENKSSQIESDSPIPTMNSNKNTKDLTGIRRGRLTVIGLSRDIQKRWVVKCDCGKYTIRTAKAIKNKNNNADACTECHNLMYMKKYDYWKRTGMDKNIEDFV